MNTFFPGFERKQIQVSGATINLVAHHEAESFMRHMSEKYPSPNELPGAVNNSPEPA